MHELTRSGSIRAVEIAQWHVRALQSFTVLLTDYKLPVLCTSLQTDLRPNHKRGQHQAFLRLSRYYLEGQYSTPRTHFRASVAAIGEACDAACRVRLDSHVTDLSTDQASTRNLILQFAVNNVEPKYNISGPTEGARPRQTELMAARE